ncbi:MAG: histidinol-phosphate transaminase [Pseudomonadota bacterium]
MAIEPYVGGKGGGDGKPVVKLSSNENPLGPSPRAREAMAAAAGSLALYPDGGATGLRRAIAAQHGLDAGRLVCGAGSDEIIALLCQAYAGPGAEVLSSQHAFLMYRLSALATGADYVAAPDRGLETDPDALIAHMGPATRLVFVADPNNPTGTMIGRAGLARIADALPPQALLVVDGAYAEYLDDPAEDAGLSLAAERENVVATRTFSKIHGLAALRLGWAYGPAHVIDVLNRVRGPFNVSAPALAAGAAAVGDGDWVVRCRTENARLRDWLTAEIRTAGLGVTESHANFLLVEAGERAEALNEALAEAGLIVRTMGGYGLPGHLRISIGDQAACEAVAAAIRAFAGRNTERA